MSNPMLKPFLCLCRSCPITLIWMRICQRRSVSRWTSVLPPSNVYVISTWKFKLDSSCRLWLHRPWIAGKHVSFIQEYHLMASMIAAFATKCLATLNNVNPLICTARNTYWICFIVVPSQYVSFIESLESNVGLSWAPSWVSRLNYVVSFNLCQVSTWWLLSPSCQIFLKWSCLLQVYRNYVRQYEDLKPAALKKVTISNLFHLDAISSSSAMAFCVTIHHLQAGLHKVWLLEWHFASPGRAFHM